jgi:hypothetical protein
LAAPDDGPAAAVPPAAPAPGAAASPAAPAPEEPRVSPPVQPKVIGTEDDAAAPRRRGYWRR